MAEKQRKRQGNKRRRFFVPEGWLRLVVSEHRLRSMMSLFPGKTRKEVEKKMFTELGSRMRVVLALSGLLLVAAIGMGGREQSEYVTLQRPEIGENSITQKFRIESGEGWQEATLEISPMEYTEAQIEEVHTKAEAYLDEVILGNNTGFQAVEENLHFPETVFDSLAVTWSTDAPWLVDHQGTVYNEEAIGSETVTVTAKISYGTEFRLYERRIIVVEKTYSPEEKLLLDIEETLLSLEAQNRTEKEFSIPTRISGRTIKTGEEESLTGEGFLVLLAVVLPVLGYQSYFGSIEEKRKKRELQAKRGYTEFVTKLSLLLIAGVSVRQAFSRLAKEYTETYGEEFVLAKELHVTCQELAHGYPEALVYEAFGNRIGLVAYQRMASLLTQNVTKGIQNLRQHLLAEAKEVMAEERANIKIRGEQAGTKLLLPMMGFLVLIFAILLVPAFGMF